MGGWNNEITEFPFRSAKGIVFENKEQAIDYVVENYGNNPSQGLYYSAMLVCPLDLFVDAKIQDFIQRFNFCEKFKTDPFPGCYDDQPAVWVDFCNLMMEELPKCQKEYNKIGN